jgi:sulfur relay (sulfurtransferase) complex TusBCD TusD component (DsrE family)
MSICEHDHADVAEHIAELPSNQKNTVRHVCAGCAYDRGFKDGTLWVLKDLQKKIDERLRQTGLPEMMDLIVAAMEKMIHG